MKKKVLIPTKLDKAARDILVSHGAYEVVQDDSKDIADVAAAHTDAYALIVRSEKVTAAIINMLPALKVVVRAGSGYDNIDTRHARAKGVDVLNTPGANANAVAEEVVALMLADARHVIEADVTTRAGKWEKNKFMGREITGKTVGIVGLGNIGQLVARRLSGFEVHVLGYDPVISSEKAAQLGLELCDLKSLFARSDYVTLHIPENDETRGMVNDELLSSMKTGATVINCARAGIIDEASLRKAKSEKRVRFLNDVYEKDAAGPKSVADIADIMLPHLGASTVEANLRAALRAAEELIELDDKGVTSFIVNRDIPDGLDATYCELANMLARMCRALGTPGTTLTMIETSVYGTLAQYADWLLVPIVAGLWPNFDRSLDSSAAKSYLKEMGIRYANREADARKGYGASITVDLTSAVDAGNLRRVSVRGTVVENTLMVSRINEFDKLYFEPHGHTVLFLYEDRPGVLGTIGTSLAAAGINIEDMRNPHDPKTNHSLAIMKINKAAPPEIVEAITRKIGALSAFHIHL